MLTLETYIILVTSITPINLIKNNKMDMFKHSLISKKDYQFWMTGGYVIIFIILIVPLLVLLYQSLFDKLKIEKYLLLLIFKYSIETNKCLV